MPPASEERVRLDVHPNEEVAGRRSVRAGLASAGELDPRAVLHAGRDLHLEAPRAPLDAAARARRTRRLDDPTVAVAARARLRHLERALVHRDLPRAAALRTRDRAGARRRTRPVARLTRRGTGDPHRHRRPGHRVVEGDGDVRLEVRAPRRARPATSSAPRAAAEQPAEQIAEVADVEVDVLEPDALSAGPPAGEAPGAVPRRRHLPDLVVPLALVLVADDVVGGRDLLESVLGALFPGCGRGGTSARACGRPS